MSTDRNNLEEILEEEKGMETILPTNIKEYRI
jgi:hypothetical protein